MKNENSAKFKEVYQLSGLSKESILLNVREYIKVGVACDDEQALDHMLKLLKGGKQ